MWRVVKCDSDAAARAAYEVLTKEGIIAQATRMALPFTQDFPAVGFPEEEKGRALAALGRHDGPTTATRNPNVRLVLTDPVTAVLQRGDVDDLILGVFGLYVAELPERAVLVTSPHGSGCLPTDEEGVLHVRLYSAPVVKPVARPVPAAYGRVLPFGIRDGVMASTVGSPIAAPEGAVAEFVGRNLYILFDVSHPSDAPDAACEVLAQILEAYVERVGERDADLELRYIQAAERRQGLRLLRARKRREVAAENLQNAEAAREFCLRALDQTQVDLHEIESSRVPGPEKLRHEFEALWRLPHIRSVAIEGGILVVRTDGDILVQLGGQSYAMGPFRIEIPLWVRGRIRIASSAPRSIGGQTYHSPHVFGDGNPCLGGFGPGVAKLLDDHEWALAVQLVLEYLHSVNVSETRAVETLTQCWTPLATPQLCKCQELHVGKGE